MTCDYHTLTALRRYPWLQAMGFTRIHGCVLEGDKAEVWEKITGVDDPYNFSSMTPGKVVINNA